MRVSCPKVDEVTAWMLPKPVSEFTGVESVLRPPSSYPGAEEVQAGVCGSCSWWDSSISGFCGTGLESTTGPCLRDFCAECMRKFILEIFEKAWGFWFSYVPPAPPCSPRLLVFNQQTPPSPLSQLRYPHALSYRYEMSF